DNKNNFPVYNDATCAGIIASVNGCTRVLISEEADVLLPSIGAVLPSPFVNKDVPTVKSEARVEMMKMFDGDCHMRKLKGNISKMDSFKHSFIGASSGGIIVTALQRKSNGSQVDAFFERLIIWCLRPPPLMFVPERLFENFELYYDVDSDKMMVDFGNQYTTLAYEQTDRYLMAKIGKMIQLTHRLVGLIQILEWSWKIAAEYLRINGYFTSCISNDFISNIRQIFERLHGEDNGDKRTFVVSVVSVERAINISQALLEQYKVIMRVPDDPARVVSAHSNKVESNAMERTSINHKLEKSKSKYGEHVRGILLFKSVIFTSTTLYKACSVFRHHSGNVNSVLQELFKMGLIIAFDNGIISSTKKAVVYAKWLPNVNDLEECQRFEQKLATFNDDLISADSIVACTTAISLLPHKANPKPAVLNYLKNERYAQLKLDFCANNLASEGAFDVSEAGEDSNSSSVLLEGLTKPNEVPLTGFFCSYDKDSITSTRTELHISTNNGSVTNERRMVASKNIDNGNNSMQENINVIDSTHISSVSSLAEKGLMNTIETGQAYNYISKRKSIQRNEESDDDEDNMPLRVRIRSIHNNVDH
ncbi:unnamed protein product, partial [Rotaria sordida]